MHELFKVVKIVMSRGQHLSLINVSLWQCKLSFYDKIVHRDINNYHYNIVNSCGLPCMKDTSFL
jgi:hypothetical protein